MAFKIVGTIGCRHTGDKGWIAFVPILMGSDEYYLVLVENDISLPGHVLLHLKGKEDWKPVGTYAIHGPCLLLLLFSGRAATPGTNAYICDRPE